MDDEEYTYQALQELLYRVETGNYEYRLILRCRQDAKIRFAKMRSDVLVKLELLDQKHVQDIVSQLQRLISALATFHNECHVLMKNTTIFPIELDLSKSCTFQYPDLDVSPFQDEPDDEDDDLELVQGLEVKPDEADTQLIGNLLNSSETTNNQNDDLLGLLN